MGRILGIFLIAVVACAPSKEEQKFDNSGIDAPKQSYVVRVNNQSGQAEYAPADFGPETNANQLAQFQNQNLQWTPLQQQNLINQQVGYPQAYDRQMYFVQDPRNYSVQHSGYQNYPNYYGQHYYPQYPQYPHRGPWGGWQSYWYQPTFYYNNAWVYWRPHHWYQNYYYSYYYYSYWW